MQSRSDDLYNNISDSAVTFLSSIQITSSTTCYDSNVLIATLMYRSFRYHTKAICFVLRKKHSGQYVDLSEP